MAVNPNELFNQQIMTDRAKELLAQNTPIEMVAQQTGLPREQLLNIVNSTMDIGRPPIPTASPGGLGDLTGQIEPNVANAMPNLGTDIADYLTDELGFKPEMMSPEVPGEIDKNDASNLQNINLANAQVMIDDPSQATELLEAQSILSGVPEEDAIDVYKKAMADYSGIDYKSLVPVPDKSFAIMMAGLNLLESGTKGEDWSTAVTSAAGAFAATYGKEKQAYKKAINSIDLQKAMSTDKSIRDFIGKRIEADFKIQNEMLTGTRKEYLVKLPGAESPTIMQLTSPQVGMYQNKFGLGNVTEYDPETMGSISNYTITYLDGSTSKRPMTNTQASEYIKELEDGRIGGFVKSGVETSDDEFQIMVRDKNARKDTPFTFRYVNQEGLTNLLNNQDLEVKTLPKAGTNYEVVNLETDQLERVPAEQYFNNPDRYRLKSGFSASIQNGDSVINISEDGNNFSLLNDNKAGTEIEKVATQFRSRKFLTNQILEQTSNVKNLVMSMENPDLAFNNLAGSALEFGRRVIATVNAGAKAFESSYGENSAGESVQKFQYKIGDKNVAFSDFKQTILSSEGFKELEKSGLGQFIIRSSPDRARAQAALFNIALSGAAAAGGDPSPDLRAISDKDMELFLRRVGANASNATDFLAVLGDFERDMINSELNYYNSALDLPIKRTRRVKNPETGLFEDQLIDMYEQRGLYKQADDRRVELEKALQNISTPRVSDRGASTPSIVKNISLNPLQTSTGIISPLDSTGFSLPNINDASYEELVGYAASLDINEAKTFNQNLKKYFTNTRQPDAYKYYLNFYKNAGIK